MNLHGSFDARGVGSWSRKPSWGWLWVLRILMLVRIENKFGCELDVTDVHHSTRLQRGRRCPSSPTPRRLASGVRGGRSAHRQF